MSKQGATTTTTVNTKRDATNFRKAAKAYVANAGRSQQSARTTLVRLGTHTKSGRVAKNYK